VSVCDWLAERDSTVGKSSTPHLLTNQSIKINFLSASSKMWTEALNNKIMEKQNYEMNKITAKK